jgi:hypothetical protein
MRSTLKKVPFCVCRPSVLLIVATLALPQMLLGGDLGVTMIFPLLSFLLSELRVGTELLSSERRAFLFDRQRGVGVNACCWWPCRWHHADKKCQGKKMITPIPSLHSCFSPSQRSQILQYFASSRRADNDRKWLKRAFTAIQGDGSIDC